jgi:hypothetical protein
MHPCIIRVPQIEVLTQLPKLFSFPSALPLSFMPLRLFLRSLLAFSTVATVRVVLVPRMPLAVLLINENEDVALRHTRRHQFMNSLRILALFKA